MADLIPADEATTADTVREARIAHVLDLMVNKGLSQAAACQEAGLPLRSFQRDIGHSRVLAQIRQQTDGVLAMAVMAAYDGYLSGIQRLVAIVQDEDVAPRDTINAVKALHQILTGFGGQLVVSTGATVDDEPGYGAEAQRVRVAFNPDLLMRGPITVRIGQSDGRPRLMGDSDLDQPENPAAVVLVDRPVAGGEQAPDQPA